MHVETPVRYSDIVRAQLRENERRRNLRVPVNVGGRCLIGRSDEADCRVVDLSVGGVLVAVDKDHRPMPGVKVVLYASDRELGRLEGEVMRRTDEGFVMSLQLGPAKRAKIERMVDTIHKRLIEENEQEFSAPRM